MFEFATATKIIHGLGASSALGSHVSRFGQRGLLITGRTPARYQAAIDSLTSHSIELVTLTASGEPTIESAAQAAELARDANIDFVVAIGGGSVLDLGKAAACLASNPGSVLDYLEVIGRGMPIARPSLPFIAVPTTSGTGAEVTRNAVLGSKTHGVKVSLRSEWMLPALAVIDAELTVSLPRKITAATGLDAFTQVLEPYLSCAANPMTDALCLEALRRAGPALPETCRNGSNISARNDMSLVSLFGGLALANSKLGAVHGLAGPLGGMLDAPHGALCARLLPAVFEINLRALHSRRSDSAALPRFTHAAQVVLNDAQATPGQLMQWLQDFCIEEQIPSLSDYGFAREDIRGTVEKAQRASSMKGNPLPLTDDEVSEILERAM